MNVAISRAKKTLDIFYLEDLLQVNLIKKDEDNAEMLKFRELYSLEKILKKQKR
ncbi:hypothetical protein MYMA111404_03060 [Mycoplasma marinum]|uniref:hypothetical protein n=1 Tax=Mycoplasma marinum TaxID=1937190 RepID=UPI001443E16E|nr:hypothetical protein [Mycoplasma marinum]